MAIKGGTVWVADAPLAWATRAKKTGLLKGDRRSGMLYGVACVPTLDLIREAAGRLPPPAEELRISLIRRQQAVEAERGADMPCPVVDYPVRRKLYAHQVRGANMALLAMGIVEPGADRPGPKKSKASFRAEQKEKPSDGASERPGQKR